MTTLRPEKRMDKTGKLVTRHVKDAPAPGVGSSPIPAPSLLPKASRSTAPQLDQLNLLMQAANKGREISTDKQIFMIRLDSEQADTLIDAFTNKEGFGALFNACARANELNTHQVSNIAKIYDPEIFNSFGSHSKLTEARKNALRVDAYGRVLFYGRREAFGNKGAITTNVSDEEAEGLRGLAKIYSAFRERSDVEVKEVLPFRELLEDHSADDVAGAIRDGHTDIQSVRGVLNGSASSVAKGWL